MNLTEPFVLQSDVALYPCVDLHEDTRRRITFEDGDFALSRSRGRTLAQVIDGDTAALLALFREPRTIVDAVIENSRGCGSDPETRLDELLPHLEQFVHSRVLVPAGSNREKELQPQYESGEQVAGWTVVRCASMMEDSEVYELRNGGDAAALKIGRNGAASLAALFENELEVLRHLDGTGIAPRLLETGMQGERPYLVIEWLPGEDSETAAQRCRHDRAALIRMCASIAGAYAALHERGVLHGDVHPRNVFVSSGGAVLLDFGYARLAGQPPRTGRGGLNDFFEPEYMAAARAGTTLPSSAAGEQYALGALLYSLITGKSYLDFRYDLAEMRRQVEDEPPVPFAKWGVPPWPEVEEILFRALEKDPARRHASVAEMAALLASAREAAVRESLATPLSASANELLETALQSFARGGERFVQRYPQAPTASINFGCAGAAAGLLRIAEARGDAALLALADVWRSRAVALIGSEGAYYDAEGDISREIAGEVTPYHTESGIHAVAAMIGAAMGHEPSLRASLGAFLLASSRPCAELDLTLGRSGSLLAAAMLLPISRTVAEAPQVQAFGTETMRAIWDELDGRPVDGAYLGMAHGWTGYLYAALRWCAASGDPLPPRLVERLRELAALRIPRGRGAFWGRGGGGWCNGSAGQVFLFTLAHHLLGDGEWLQLAELAAWNNWEEACTSSTLCCGSAGRAYALLNLYRHTGATEWLGRARQLANHAAANASVNERAGALWKGELGVAVLIADLESPENARMPFFE